MNSGDFSGCKKSKVGKDKLLIVAIQNKNEACQKPPFKGRLRGIGIFCLLLGMDEKILIYLVIGIIYFIFNRLKKKDPQEESEADRPSREPRADGPKPMSFEELLREITEGKQQKPAEPVVQQKPAYIPPSPQPAYVDYDDDIEVEEKNLEKRVFDQDKINEVYESAKKQAFNRPSLEESLKLADVNTAYGKFKAFESKQEASVLSKYVKDLRDPQGFKKALILSEIINRKHF
jgi:hypothetical protein